MRTMRLVARRDFKYNTRRLLPGDEFEADRRHAVALIAARKAREVRKLDDVPPPPPAVAAKIQAAVTPPSTSDEVKALREEYRTKVGRAPFPGWGADALREKIAAATTGN